MNTAGIPRPVSRLAAKHHDPQPHTRCHPEASHSEAEGSAVATHNQHPNNMPPSRLSLLAQSLFYVAAGVNHFWHEDFYRHIMPDHYSHPGDWVLLTGAAEILGGLGLLIPQTRRPAAFGIALMLAGYFDVHIFMLRHADRFPDIPR